MSQRFADPAITHKLPQPMITRPAPGPAPTAWLVKGWRLAAGVAIALLLATVAPARSQTSGTVPSGSNSGGATAGDPVYLNNGSYQLSLPLLDLGGLLPLGETLYYNLGASSFDEGKGFYHQILSRILRYADSAAILVLGDSSRYQFSKQAGAWTLVNVRTPYQLIETGSDRSTGYYYLLDPARDLVMIFEKYDGNGNGRLKWVFDRNQNRLTYGYGVAPLYPETVVEGDGSSPSARKLTMTTANGALAAITEKVYNPDTAQEEDGRQVVYEYGNCSITPPIDPEDDPNLRNYLCSVTDPLGNRTGFEATLVEGPGVYTDALVKVTRPLGNVPYAQTHTVVPIYANLFSSNSWARVTAQTDAYGHTTQFSYDPFKETTPWSVQTTETQPDGSPVVYRHPTEKGPLQARVDPLGNAAGFQTNPNNQHTGVLDRNGNQVNFGYHAPSGQLASIENFNGSTTTPNCAGETTAAQRLTFTYRAQTQTFTNPANGESVSFTFYDLTRRDYPDCTADTLTYDGQGNPLTWSDQAGQTWIFTYDAKGQVLTATNPSGGVTTYNYHDDSTLATRQDSDTGITTFGYDRHKRVNRITHPDGTSIQITYDANDQVTSLTDENNQTFVYTYDGNGNLLEVQDPAGHKTQYAYDLMDRVTQLTDRRGKTTALGYDVMGRLATLTQPTGRQDSYGYDPRGWLNAVQQGGQTWRTTYDPEGLPTADTTPLSRVTGHERDKLGFLTAVTDPLGQRSTLARNPLSQMTGLTDPLGRTQTYQYDARQALTGVTLPDGGSAAYARNALGDLSTLTDLNGQSWTFAYSPIGRLTGQIDPLGRATQISYDNRGRPSGTTYPDGAASTLSYDAAGNLNRVNWPDLQLDYGYDALDRLIAATGINLTRDPEGRITSTGDFGAAYDDDGRLSRVTYPFDGGGTFMVSYTYDPTTGLLTGVQDSLTGARVTFLYDADRRLTGIDRSNGVTTRYTLDAASRPTRIQDTGILDLIYTYDASGQITSLDLTAPLDPADHLIIGGQTLGYDAAAQISTAGYTYDPCGRQTAAPGHTYGWDGASRLISRDDIQLGYNGLGDLVTRTQAGVTTQFAHHYALGVNPLVAEKDAASGQFRRWYVWTPAGRLLYVIDRSAGQGYQVYFYHGDHLGSVLALTDANGVVTDAYAYSPTGELLAHQGSSDQPFTFVGQWGVHQESPSLYQMGARYYDAQTGRFISPEPLWPQIGEPRMLNPYQYALNNPVGYVDPNGLQGANPMDMRYSSMGYPSTGYSGMNRGRMKSIYDMPSMVLAPYSPSAWLGSTQPSPATDLSKYVGRSKSTQKITQFLGTSSDLLGNYVGIQNTLLADALVKSMSYYQILEYNFGADAIPSEIDLSDFHDPEFSEKSNQNTNEVNTVIESVNTLIKSPMINLNLSDYIEHLESIPKILQNLCGPWTSVIQCKKLDQVQNLPGPKQDQEFENDSAYFDEYVYENDIIH